MGAFGGFTLTNRGRALQSKAQAGAQLNYTKAMVGDGTITSQSIVTMTALISPKMTLPITRVTAAPPDRAYVETKLSNQDITTGFYFREIGIYAQDPDLGEILYAYANSGSGAEYIPPNGGSDVVEKSMRMNIFVGTATNITATIDSSLVFPTYEQVEDMIAGVQITVIDSETSTDKTKPPSADALRRVNVAKQDVLRLADNYLAASVLVNATADPNTGRAYPDGVSMFKVSSAAAGWPASNGYVLTFRAGSGGYQIFYEMYTGTTQTDKTARQWTRSKRDTNAFWQDWARVLTEVDDTALKAYIDNKPWQKHKLTEDTGVSRPISGTNLNDLLKNGEYIGQLLVNGPTPAAEFNWYYIDVEVLDSNKPTAYVKQTAQALNTNTFQIRTCVNGTWSAWTDDLFTSVVNGKASIEGAVGGKGGTVSKAGSVPTFAELVAGINSIVLGYKATAGGVTLYDFGFSGTNVNPTYTRQFFVRTNIPGTFRLNYTVVNNGSGLGYARVYKNGVPYGVERVLNPGSPTTITYSEDLYFAAGDTIEFWTRAQTTNSNNVRLDNVKATGSTAIFSTT